MKHLGKTIDPNKDCWDPKERRIRWVTLSFILYLKLISLEVASSMPSISGQSTLFLQSDRHLHQNFRPLFRTPAMKMTTPTPLMTLKKALKWGTQWAKHWLWSNRCVLILVLNRILTLFQIRKSPQARAYFKRICGELGLPELELVQWVRTRWSSLYYFLTRILLLREV